MSRIAYVVAFVTLAAFELAAQSAQIVSHAVPKQIGDRRNQSGRPAWVSIDVALREDGRLRPEYFSDAARYQIERNQEKNSDLACNGFLGAPALDHFKRVESLDSLVGNSLSIIVGRIVAARDGFYLGTPGKLFAVDPEAYLKSFAGVRSKGYLYLFVAETKILTPRGAICSTAGAGVPLLKSGDRIVAFSYLKPVDDEVAILPVDVKTQLIFERAGRLYAPVAVRTADFKRIDDLVFAVRSNRRLAEVPDEVRR